MNLALRGVGGGLIAELPHQAAYVRGNQLGVLRPAFDAAGRANLHESAAAAGDLNTSAELQRRHHGSIRQQLFAQLDCVTGDEGFWKRRRFGFGRTAR